MQPQSIHIWLKAHFNFTVNIWKTENNRTNIRLPNTKSFGALIETIRSVSDSETAVKVKAKQQVRPWSWVVSTGGEYGPDNRTRVLL